MAQDSSSYQKALEAIVANDAASEISASQAERALHILEEALTNPSDSAWKKLEEEIASEWPVDDPFSESFYNYVLEQRRAFAPAPTTSDFNDISQFFSQETAHSSADSSSSAGSARPHPHTQGAAGAIGSTDTDRQLGLDEELILLDPEFLPITAIFGVAGMGASGTAFFVKDYVSSAFLRHVVTREDRLLDSYRLDQYLEDEDISAADFVRQCGSRIGGREDVKAELLNCDLRSAFARLAAFEDSGDFGVLVLGTKQPAWSVVFASDARLLPRFEAMLSELCRHGAHSFLVSATPSSASLRFLPAKVATRYLWGIRAITGFSPDPSQTRHVRTVQDEAGRWRVKEHGPRQFWEPNIDYRSSQAGGGLSAREFRGMLRSFTLDPWVESFYRAPFYLITAPRWVE
ncbi:MAG: hypothetical protein Q4P06_03255 [Actinomycetaceae bacterium]|nr:hypothetical protein [Actinomycetaceae bacterium]